MAPSYASFARWTVELRGCYDGPVEARYRVADTWDQLLTAWLVRQGVVEVRAARRRLVGRAGDWILLTPGLRRRHRFSNDARILSLRCLVADASGRFPGQHAQPCVGRWPELEAPALAVLTAMRALTRDDAATAPAGRRHDLAELAPVQACAVRWVAAALTRLGVDEASAIEPRVAAAQSALVGALSPAPIAWPELTRVTGLARAQLDRLFRLHHGRSVRGWRSDRLLAEACRELDDPANAVRVIADRLGFADASHFSRWFRQRTGEQPARWRARHGV